MPSLVYRRPGQQKFSRVSLYKPMTSIGSAKDNDIVIADPDIRPNHAIVHFDGECFKIQAVDRHCKISINEKKVKKRTLAHKDELRIGKTVFNFLLVDESTTRKARSKPSEETVKTDIQEIRKLTQFSQRLMDDYDFPKLLLVLLDSVLEVTGGAKGILVLNDATGGSFHVRAARDNKGRTLKADSSLVSDSIIHKVLENRQAIIVADAQSSAEFNASKSIVNLGLSSVMCVPLMNRGSLMGALYVGNNSIKNLFTSYHLELLTVFAAQAALILSNALLVNELRLDNEQLNQALNSIRYGEIIGASEGMKEIFRKINKVANTDVTVLVQGETGTGKELIARELHNRSDRAKKPFITINCGAIPETLLESELFGHVRGAFTGATQNKKGKFHLAHTGTIFLDELGEMPLNLQVKLLRVLQEKVVTRVGDTKSEQVDIRVVAATNRKLDEEVRAGNFREDLFYRLNVVTLHLPPLRKRGDDIVLIANYLLNKYCDEYGCGQKTIGPEAAIAMKKYAWPGNIRQLENRLKKAVILADKPVLSASDLDLQPEDLEDIMTLQEAKERFQRRYINEVLARNGGNRTKSARDLGVDPRTIFRHLEKEAQY